MTPATTTATTTTATPTSPAETLNHEDAPTSFGSFKPTGHVMIGLPDAAAVQGLRDTLHQGGWRADHVQDFTPRETLEDMALLIDNASPLAGFGSEIMMMRRYLDEARRGTRWLLVKAEGEDTLQRLADMARRHGARLAVSYRTLVIEDLI